MVVTFKKTKRIFKMIYLNRGYGNDLTSLIRGNIKNVVFVCQTHWANPTTN